MATTLIRGNTQILSGSISWDRMAAMVANLNFQGFEALNAASPTLATSLATKGYVDAAISGLAIRRARVIATSNLSLTAPQTIDGVSCIAGDRVWANAQTTASQDGLWVVAAGAWSRPNDWAAASSQKSSYIFIEEGTTNHDTKWILSTDAITVDTTSLTPASQDSSASVYTAGTGLTLSSFSFSVNYGTTGTTAAVGNDARITGALQTSALGTGVATALGVNVGTAGAFVVLGGAGGTPSSLTLTNATGLPLSTGVTGTLAAAQFPALTGDVTTTASSLATTINHTAGSGFLKYTDLIYNETPGGLVNSSNTSYTLANTPQNSSQELFINGVLQEPGAGNDYTISGTTITMLYTPTTGDKLRVYYVK